MSQQRHTKPVRRPFKDFFIATLCLGIPYLFANRHMYHHFDPEGGLVRSAGPMLVVGASVCIVACLSGFFLIVTRANRAPSHHTSSGHSLLSTLNANTSLPYTPSASTLVNDDTTGRNHPHGIDHVSRSPGVRPGWTFGWVRHGSHLRCEPVVFHSRGVSEPGRGSANRGERWGGLRRDDGRR